MFLRKVLFLLSLSVFLSVSTYAIDFVSTSGKEYKNATVLKVMPDGLVISYVNSDGFEDVDHIKTPELPDDIRKEYNLSLAKAKTFDTQREDYIEAVDSKREAADKAYYAKQKKEVNDFQNVQEYLASVGVQITFSSINSEDFGSIGYAYRYDDFDQDAPFGLICLLGKSIEPQSKWVGKIYPLNKEIEYMTPFPASGNIGSMAYSQVGPGGQPEGMGQSNPNAGEPSKQKIPCYADYATALGYLQTNKDAKGDN